MHDASEPEESRQKTGSKMRDRLLKGLGAQGFSQAVQIFIRLAEVPLLLSFWGTQLYGEWLMLSAIPVYLSIADGGFTGVACREMTIRNSSGNRNGTLSIFQSTWVLLILVSITAGLLAFGFVQVAPLSDWLGFANINNFEVKVIFLLLVVYVLVGFQGSLLNGGYWIIGRYSSSMYFTAIIQLLEFAGLATALAFGGGPVLAACGYLCGRLLGVGLMWFGQLKVTPWLRCGISHASIVEIKQLTAPALASLAFPFGNALNIQGMRLVVGLVLGPSAVALFVPLRTLSRLIMQPAAIINRLIEPELALAHGARDSSLFQRLFVRSCQLTLWGCLGACFLSGCSAHWIFPAWTGSIIEINWLAYIIFLIGVLVNSIWYTALMVPYAINRHASIALSYAFVYGAATFGFGFLGATCLGISGVACVLLLAEASMTVIVLRDSLRMTGVSITQWVKTVLNPPLSIFGQSALVVRKRIISESE